MPLGGRFGRILWYCRSGANSSGQGRLMATGRQWNRRLVTAGGVAAALGAGYFAFRGPPGGGFTFASGDARILRRGNGSEPETLDPHKMAGQWEDNIAGDMMVGLMHQDPQGRPIPCACESVSRSPDGLTLTFHLRDHLWSDGKPVTAEDYVFSYRRIVDPKTAAQYVAMLYPIHNVQEAASGKVPPDQIGVRALDARTLEIRLIYQMPYFADFFMHHTSYAVPRHVVEKHGEAWMKPANIAVNGPFILKEWIPNDHILLEKNPRFYDAANVKFDRVYYYPTEDTLAAFRRFRAGELDLVYKGVPLSQVPLLRKTVPGILQIAPMLACYYLAVNHARPPFNDRRVRRALSLGIDRETLVEKVGRAGQRAAYGIVPGGIADYPHTAALDFKSLPMAARRQQARALLAEAGFGPANPLRFDMVCYNKPEWKLNSVALQGMWRQIGVEMRITPTDSQILYARLRKHDFAVCTAGWVADYADAKNYLFLFQTNNKDLNYSNYSNAKFDALVDRSDMIREAEERAKILTEAEQIMLDDIAAIPLYDDVTRDIVSPQVKGWIANPSNFNRSRFLSLDRSIRSL